MFLYSQWQQFWSVLLTSRKVSHWTRTRGSLGLIYYNLFLLWMWKLDVSFATYWGPHSGKRQRWEHSNPDPLTSQQLPLHWCTPPSSAFLGFFMSSFLLIPSFICLWKKRSLKPTEVLLCHSKFTFTC